MKLLTTLALSTLLATTIYAKESMAEDMRIMLKAMQNIEAAGFYNDKEKMQQEVKTLKAHLSSLKTDKAHSYLPGEKVHASKFAKKRAQMIEMYADDMLDSLSADKLNDALENYSLILGQCTSCHSRIRSY